MTAWFGRMTMIDSAYEKAGLQLRPTSPFFRKFKDIEIG
jgi:hypothetical protein